MSELKGNLESIIKVRASLNSSMIDVNTRYSSLNNSRHWTVESDYITHALTAVKLSSKKKFRDCGCSSCQNRRLVR